MKYNFDTTQYIDIYEDGHKSIPYIKTDSAINQRIKMIPIKCICKICGNFTTVVDIIDLQQFKRDEKLNILI
jgi:hypothetical protein